MKSVRHFPIPFRRWVLVAYWTLIYFSTHWPDIDRFKMGVEWPSDKLVHAMLYAGWAALWWWVLAGSRGRVTKAAAIWLLVGAAGYGIFDELTQAIVGRQPDVLDFSCDMLGAAGVVFVLYFWQKRQPSVRSGWLQSRA